MNKFRFSCPGLLAPYGSCLEICHSVGMRDNLVQVAPVCWRILVSFGDLENCTSYKNAKILYGEHDFAIVK